MNSLYGTVRLVSEDSLWFFGKLLFLYITIPVTLIWLLIGYIFGLGDETVVSIAGPAYSFAPIFAIAGFKSLYPIAIGLGSTRTQFLKVFYSVGLLSVVLSILFVNVLHGLLKAVFQQWDIDSNIFQPGLFLVNDYHFLTYLWIDLMFVLFLLGISFLLYSIKFRLGTQKSLFVLMLLSLVTMFLYYGGYLTNSMDWFMELDLAALKMKLISLIGLSGIIALLVTYPIMRNASLKPKARKD